MKRKCLVLFLLLIFLPLWALEERELFMCSDSSLIVIGSDARIYYSEYKNHQLKNRQPIGVLNGLLQQGWSIKNISASFDCCELYFSAKPSGATNYDLFFIRKNNGKWSSPERFMSVLNSEADELWPSMSSDGQTLFFVRQTEKKTGKRTKIESSLFYSMRTTDGNWEKPLLLTFSTGEDISPRIMSDNKTLFFASKRVTEQKKKNNYALFFAKRIRCQPLLSTINSRPVSAFISFTSLSLSNNVRLAQ